MSQLLGDAALVIIAIVSIWIVVSVAAGLPRKTGWSASLLLGCFAFYVILIGVLTIAPPPLSRSNGLWGTNLVPVFHSIRCFVPDPGQPPTAFFCLQTIFGNIIMFIPLGLMLPLVSERIVSAGKVAATAFIVSLAIEAVQYAGRWLGSPRWSDIDDVLLNVTGALLGYALLRISQSASRSFTRT